MNRSLLSLCKTRIFAALASLSLLAFAASAQQTEAASAMSSASRGVDGSPLPAKDPKVAENWPAALRNRVDAVLTVFREGASPPSKEDIERRLNIEMTDITSSMSAPRSFSKVYRTQRTDSLPPRHLSLPSMFGPYYFVSLNPSYGGQTHALGIDIEEKNFCLDPYELAIYTGASFSEGEPSHPHTNFLRWENHYSWGMFKKSPANSYAAKDFHIRTKPIRDVLTGAVLQEGCVQYMGASRTYLTAK